jgi:hypothetical protein
MTVIDLVEAIRLPDWSRGMRQMHQSSRYGGLKHAARWPGGNAVVI